MIMWVLNLDYGGTEPGAGPVGPQAGKGLMLLWVGRCVALGWMVYELARSLVRGA